jgi:4-hydroxybenzoate polyprenyltransferase
MGWSAVTEIIELPALLLYAGAIFWTLGYDTIYAHQDKEDDLLAGVKSTALKFGTHSKRYVACFYALALVLIAAGSMWAVPFSFVFLFLLPAGAHLGWQLWAWNAADPESSLKIFRSNRNAGLLMLAALALA